MKTASNSHWTAKQKKKLEDLTSDEVMESLAEQAGFMFQRTRKLTARIFVQSYILAANLPFPTFRPLAVLIGLLGNFTYSKQALSKRLDSSSQGLLERVLAHVLASRGAVAEPLKESVLQRFNRVIVQDSTVIALPSSLASIFPGSRNQTQGTQSQLKIQALLDLKTHRFMRFFINPFTKNDQSSANEVLNDIELGDLLVRDLGYFSLRSLQGVVDLKGWFLSRFRSGTSIFDKEGGALDLLNLLRFRDRVDEQIFLGTKIRISARLIAIRLPKEVGAERRRKALNNRDRRLNPSKAKLEALDWAIFITNAPQTLINMDEAIAIYRMRWRIETIFKSWKQCFRISNIPSGTSPRQLLCLFLGRMIYCALFEVMLSTAWAKYPKHMALSHQKAAGLFWILTSGMIFSQNTPTQISSFYTQLDYHCRYEHRKRPNIFESLLSLS